MDRLGGEHAVLAVALDAVHGLIGQRHQAVERPDAQVRGGDAEAGAERKHFVGTQDVIAAQCAAQPLGGRQVGQPERRRSGGLGLRPILLLCIFDRGARR